MLGATFSGPCESGDEIEHAAPSTASTTTTAVRRTPPPLTRAGLKFLGYNLDFSIDKAKRELGYHPRTSFDEGMKLIYNLTLQGKPVGTQMPFVPCPQGGLASVAGVATSNAEQGATEVNLTYGFQDCNYLRRDEEPA